MEKLKISHAVVLETVKSGGADGGEQASQQDEVPPHY